VLSELDCSRLADMLQDLPLVEYCDRMKSGALRMSTPFSYPNGEKIDVFIETDRELLHDDFHLSDHGQTALYLWHSQVVINSTSRKKELVKDILDGTGVSLQGLQLTTRPRSTEPSALSEAIFRLSQACVRLSDLATHQRLRSTNAFKDDVEDFFDARGLRWVRDIKLPPVFGKREIRMDFEVKSGNKSSYINVLAAMNDAAAHSSANEIAIKLTDLRLSDQIILQQFVTIYNSASNAVRPEDIERLQTLSSTVSFPEQIETLSAILVDDNLQNPISEVASV
jgi:Domain of unknown function DUF1828